MKPALRIIIVKFDQISIFDLMTASLQKISYLQYSQTSNIWTSNVQEPYYQTDENLNNCYKKIDAVKTTLIKHTLLVNLTQFTLIE